MFIEMWNVTKIIPYERNPRLNEAAVSAVANSIGQFGFRQPIVVDTAGVIVCGHTRWKAALQLGLEKVPVHVAKDLTPAQIRAYRIADNKTSELAQWDLDLLPAELRELEIENFDLESIGFSEEELNRLLYDDLRDGETDPDTVPEPPDEPITRPGDLWILGEHRLLCGDSGQANEVDRLLDGAKIHLVNADPPYNVRVEPRSNNAIAAGNSSFRKQSSACNGTKLRAKDRSLVNDFVSDEEFDRLLKGWFGNLARVLEPGRAFYLWGGYSNVANYPPVLKHCGLYFSQAIIWHKQHPVINRKDFMGDHEWCFYGWREGMAHKFFGPNNVPDVWSVKKVHPQSMVHLTEKPVELAVRAMQYSSLAGEHVLDLFGGSGSTLIAAEQTGRKAYLMEVDPPYCDVIVQRWEQFTGQTAQHAPAAGPSRG